MIDTPDRTKIDQIKKLGGSERLVLLGRDFPSQIYTPSTATQRPTAPYDDLTQSPSGTLIGLIKSENTTAKSLLSLSESGDLIVDSTQVGRPKVLLSGESNIRAIWSSERVFRIVRNDGSESIIDGIQ